MYTAHEVAAKDGLYNKPIYIGNCRESWECMGYARTGNSIRFARLILLPTGRILQINKYVHPDKVVFLSKPK